MNLKNILRKIVRTKVVQKGLLFFYHTITSIKLAFTRPISIFINNKHLFKNESLPSGPDIRYSSLYRENKLSINPIVLPGWSERRDHSLPPFGGDEPNSDVRGGVSVRLRRPIQGWNNGRHPDSALWKSQ